MQTRSPVLGAMQQKLGEKRFNPLPGALRVAAGSQQDRFQRGLSGMKQRRFAVFLAVLLGFAGLSCGAALAQAKAWVQVQALPTLEEAQIRARAFASAFPDVQGYRLGSRWYGIALGPYAPDQAAAQLDSLKRENLIPRDSFVTDGTNFREPFWPIEGETAPAPVAPLAVAPVAEAPVPETPVAEAPAGDDPLAQAPAIDSETPAEARRSEALLTLEDRQDLQRALQWEGFYNAAIDGAFGPGTRKSMAAWQGAMGLEETGILTIHQRATLVANWQADAAEYGFQPVSETESGIEITLPLNLVKFDHYEPPFVHFTPTKPDGLRVILISQPGDKAALFGLYDVLQTLTIMPPDGPRNRSDRDFDIEGTSASLSAIAHAEQAGGLIKGYILVWPPAEAARAARVQEVMKSSFRPLGSRALDPGMVAMSDATRRGLMAGLELRRPKFSRSGFYVDGAGHVLTTSEAVAQCGRITLDGVTEATVTAKDAVRGLALLAPAKALAPTSYATLQRNPLRLGSEITVAGYAYEDTLPAPVLTYGTLEEDKGLNGETGVARLGITTLAGDAGGPVLDGSGSVIGLLQPRASDTGRVLPEGVEFATDAATLAAFLAASGLADAGVAANAPLPPDDLTRRAMDLTVLVSCWE
jgi:peptidoglycan hydrolase-like protein with peptidoglycan-binding domain